MGGSPCRMSNLRNGHVAVSNLVVQTHYTTPAGSTTLILSEISLCYNIKLIDSRDVSEVY